MNDDFAEFAAQHLPRLVGFGVALTGSPDDGWDLAQEALTRLGVRWGRRDIEKPEAYTRTIMVRLNIDRIRRIRREVPSLFVNEERTQAVTFVHENSSEWLESGLANLTPKQRTALALRFVEDLDLRGIAAAMNCSQGTVKSHLSRGLQALRDHASTHKFGNTNANEIGQAHA